MAGQDLDTELNRILEIAGERKPVRVELPAPQAAVWPWQVPQVPTITSDRAPNNNNSGQ